MAEIIFSRYSNERAREFSIRTDILEDENGRYVRKTALFPEGREHVRRLFTLRALLDESYAAAPFLCNVCRETEDGVILEYLEGKTLEEILDGLLEEGRKEEAELKLLEYLRKVKMLHEREPFHITEEFQQVFGPAHLPGEHACAAVTNIDLVCSNLVQAPVPWVLDYEWTFTFPVPCKFVLYRIIHYYLETSVLRNCLDEERFYGPMEISPAQRAAFAEMEKHFQEYITRGHCAIRDLYAAVSPGIVKIKRETVQSLTVFFGYGNGYRAEDSVSFPFRDGAVRAEVKIPPGCRTLRLDPGDLPCGAEVERLSFGEIPADLKKAVIPEGRVRENWVYIPREDPAICDIPVPEGAGSLSVSMKLHLCDREMLLRLMRTGMSPGELRGEMKKELKQEVLRVRDWVKDPEGGRGREYLRGVLAKGAAVRGFLGMGRGGGNAAPGTYAYFEKSHRPSREEMERQKQEVFLPAPLFSVVTPLYRTPIRHLKAFVDSVTAQSYQNWELCLADGSEGNELEKYIWKNYGKEKRIRYFHLKKNRGISGNTNAAVRMAMGDFLVFADHDDMLREDALYQAASLLKRKPDTELLYSDEDLVDAAGNPLVPHFKPDYSPDLLCCMNYICHLLVVKKELQQRVGMLKSSLDGSQDYDFILRCTEQTDKICHIPLVLYHWRVHGDSTAGNGENKNYAIDAGLKALRQHYERTGAAADAEYTGTTVVYRTKYRIQGEPLVSVLIPAGDDEEELRQCAVSVMEDNSWKNCEVLILARGAGESGSAENAADDKKVCAEAEEESAGKPGVTEAAEEGKMRAEAEAEPAQRLRITEAAEEGKMRAEAEAEPAQRLHITEAADEGKVRAEEEADPAQGISWNRVRIVDGRGARSRYGMYNIGARQAKGEYLLLLDSRVRPVSSDWMEYLLGYCQREGTAVTGAKLLDSNDKVRHAGMVIGLGGTAGRLLEGSGREDAGYLRRLMTTQEMSAVSADCMMVKKSIYMELGGMDETFVSDLGGADFCLRARAAGQKVVFVPEALLCQRDPSGAPGKDPRWDIPESDRELFCRRHAGILAEGDPFYNPNLSLTRTDCSCREE